MSVDRLLPWLVRVTWGVLPLVAGDSLAAALDGRSLAVRTAASLLLWVGWAVVLLAALVPHPVALTLLRAGAPAGAAAVAAPALVGHGSPVAVATAVVAAGLAFVPESALWFVNGPAYANERRFPLRPPAALLLGPLVVAWVAVVAAPVATVLLLASEQWGAGAVGGLVGLPIAAVLSRSLHSLSRRWVVFVPSGLVLHDPSRLADPVLFQRPVVEALRPAPAGSDSLDLTSGALGLALELVLKEKVPLGLTRGRTIETGASARLLFTPSRPGRVLAEAATRRLPVER